jgi:NAD+ kinase
MLPRRERRGAPPMKKIGIIFNSEKQRARSEMASLRDWLHRQNCSLVVLSSSEKKIPRLDLALSLGGDGTMLKASRLLAPRGIPVLGINMGSLGFLAETDPRNAYPFLEKVLAGKYRIEERLMLTVSIQSDHRSLDHLALNDCIIHSGNNGRVITISASINDDFLADYVGDGLIVATPTGSTAYSLAASGPIVHPHLSVFVLTPICPHTLAQRPLIISADHPLTLSVKLKSPRQKPILSIDGQMNYIVGPKDRITIAAADQPLRVIANPQQHYFQVLRTKLKWGERG